MEETLRVAKALADGNRMRVVAALFRHDELCVCQIVEMLGLTAATVSRHMSILQNARLVQSRKDGRWVYFRLADPFSEPLQGWLVSSLLESEIIAQDRLLLGGILSRHPGELCRIQKERKDTHEKHID